LAKEMKTRQTIQCVSLILACWACSIQAEDLNVRLDVGTQKDRVTFSVVVENNTDESINLMPRLFDGTNAVSSSLLWKVNSRPAEFLPKRAFLMFPPFDTKILPPHSTNAVALVEDDELFFVAPTTNTHSRLARAALSKTGEYKILVVTVGDWGGHPADSATVTVNIEKEAPTKPCTLLPEGAASGKK
jgi:hypothetical protein